MLFNHFGKSHYNDKINSAMFHLCNGYPHAQCLKLGRKSCSSSCLESQVMNIKLMKNQQRFPGPPPKLSASDWQPCGNIQHCSCLERWSSLYSLQNKVFGEYIGFTPSICPSYCLSRILCPFCSPYISGWIHFIFIKQLQQVCHV